MISAEAGGHLDALRRLGPTDLPQSQLCPFSPIRTEPWSYSSAFFSKPRRPTWEVRNGAWLVAMAQGGLALGMLECHPDRSGRFLDGASLLHPASPESPREDGVPRLECRPQTFSPTSNWASQPEETRAKGSRPHSRSGPGSGQALGCNRRGKRGWNITA